MHMVNAPRFRAALANEIAGWQKEELISKETADILLDRYRSGTTQSTLINVLTILGAVLIGLGTLLFIGANWHLLASVWKLALIFAAIAASHAAGWHFSFEPGSRPKLGAACLLLGQLFFGAGIWLVSQIYNLETDISQGMLLWACGSAISAIVTRSPAVAVLTIILGTIWMFVDSGRDFESVLTRGVTDPHFFIASAAMMFIAYRAVSPWALTIQLLGMVIWLGVFSGLHIFGIVLGGLALFGVYLWHHRNRPMFEAPYKYVSVIATLLGMLWLTSLKADVFTIELARLAIFTSISTAIICLFAGRGRQANLSAGTGFVALATSLGACISIDVVRLFYFNALMIAVMVALVVAGLKVLRSPSLMTMAIVFFVLDIICRYFDVFFSMLDRSFFFILGGVVLLAAGAVAERSRRNLIRELAT